MNLQLLFSGATSACFELVNRAPYYAPEKFTIYLDDREIRQCETNVFSLFGLTPDTTYTVTARGDYLEAAYDMLKLNV